MLVVARTDHTGKPSGFYTKGLTVRVRLDLQKYITLAVAKAYGKTG